MNIKLISNNLQKIGLEDEEIQIYSTLLKLGVQSIQQLSKTTNINRSTCYRYAEKLKEKRLIDWIVTERGVKIQAVQPESLLDFYEERLNEFKEIRKDIASTINLFKNIKPAHKFNSQVRYYSGESGYKQMIWNTLSAEEITRSYTVFKRRYYIDSKFEEKVEAEWARRKLKDKVITYQNRFNYIKNILSSEYLNSLNIRIISSKKYYISNDLMIYNDIVSIASYDGNEVVGVEIENPEIARTQKSIFDIVWESAREVGI